MFERWPTNGIDGAGHRVTPGGDCEHTLKGTINTPSEAIPEETKEYVHLLAGEYLARPAVARAGPIFSATRVLFPAESISMSDELEGKTVGIVLAPRGTEEVEFTEPREAIEDAGGSVDVLGVETGDVETVNGDLDPAGTYEIERSFDDATVEEYDGLVVPGGTVGADTLRGQDEPVQFVHDFFATEKPLCVICHGPWTLVEADVVDGRTLTSYHSLATDVRNAGGEWVDEEVVVDEGLVTSRNPDDLDAFCDKVIEEIEEGPHDDRQTEDV